MAAQRSYSREEMEEILRRAAERTHEAEDAVRHEDLVAAAREVGIDPSAIDDALVELGAQRTAEDAEKRWRAQARRRFVSHFSTYAIVMAFLGALNYLVTPAILWAVWIALGWGLAVAFSARRAILAPTPEQIEKMLAREEKQAARKAKREARRRAAEEWQRRWRALAEEARLASEARARRGSVLEKTEREIDRAIEDGVNALVAALGKRAASAAKTIAAEVEAAVHPRTEFERYVARQKTPASASPSPTKASATEQARANGPLVTPPPPRTRVAEPDEALDVEEPEEARTRARPQRREKR